jgi:hypothetical protein
MPGREKHISMCTIVTSVRVELRGLHLRPLGERQSMNAGYLEERIELRLVAVFEDL